MFGFGKAKKTHRVRLQPSGVELDVQPGDNLLKAGLAAGLGWPHDCRVGSCGTCKARLVDGKIKELSDFAYVLSGDELDKGMILACQTALQSDLVVEVALNTADASARPVATVAGEVSATRMLTHDIMELSVRLERPLREDDSHYLAGQYADLSFPDISAPRSYSFATPPEDDDRRGLTFFIRKVPQGELTTWLFDADRTGCALSVTGPFGSFWLRDGDGPIICVAGGSGMSSIKALLEHAANVGCARDVVFLFGARSQRDLYCLDAMESVAARWHPEHSMRFLPILSDEPEGSDWAGPRGLVTEQIGQQDLDWSRAQGYLCGPPGMIDAAIDVLHAQGIGPDAIHFDKFLDASSIPGGRH
jgi:xylene monooxygenase electron transfer component